MKDIFGGTKGEVERTPDFRRIEAIPRRKTFDSDRITRELTEVLRLPDGTQSLRPVQAQAIYEAAKVRGLFGNLRVGAGKTLISLILAYVLDLRRPVLLIPAALKEKTIRDQRVLASHWRITKNLKMLSYEELGRVKAAELLEQWRPDGIIADEVQRLKNKDAGVTKRVNRYMVRHPETVFCAMSGTIIKNSLLDFIHIIRWCLKELAPVPLEYGEVEAWASALDEDPKAFQRTAPGALLRFADEVGEEHDDEVVMARRGFRQRLLETEGVVATADAQVACSLYVEPLEYKCAPIVDEYFETLRRKWELPNGCPLTMAVDVWRHARELALGLHYEWDPPAPEAWINARRKWAKFVRDTLAHSRTLDTEKQVADACADGKLDATAYNAWQAIRETFRPNSVPVWHDSSALEACAAWMRKGPGIVWVEHGFFGAELERRTGVPYYRQEGLNSKGQPIEAHDPRQPMIASIAANATGRNLQAWNRNLITSLPGSAMTLEQLIGRTHRDGQDADEVTVEVLMGCIETLESWERAVGEARMAEDVWGNSQKLLIADVALPSSYEVGMRGGSRWVKTPKEKPDAVAMLLERAAG